MSDIKVWRLSPPPTRENPPDGCSWVGETLVTYNDPARSVLLLNGRVVASWADRGDARLRRRRTRTQPIFPGPTQGGDAMTTTPPWTRLPCSKCGDVVLVTRSLSANIDHWTDPEVRDSVTYGEAAAEVRDLLGLPTPKEDEG